ncbi:BREX-1 system adenine-specific DNA-methyltransferase PglX [Flavobacterium acetivorans]|nr:BREX-1 system adenine-specific DNA-methyltransferase PglX [Flavobacterium sp. F-29]UFH36970.1 BREX-1 system adenine-specific DNA-methyltransferase PglX [Flavobacterium sp. F-29]
MSTFPSLKVEIDNYPQIKEYLLSFDYDRLKQTGEKGARKKTSNKWFETQDQIGYWRDFDMPKIIWKRIGSAIRFSYDESKVVCLDSTCFAVGTDLKFILGFLNSTISKRELLNNAPKTGTGDVITSVQALEPLLIPKIDEYQKNQIIQLVDKCIELSGKKFINEISLIEKKIDEIFYNAYGFSDDEIKYLSTPF